MTKASHLSFAAKAYIASITALGAACVYLSVTSGPPRDTPRFVCYLVLAVTASCLKVPLPGVTGTMSVLFLFLLAGSVELALWETMLLGAVCVLVQCYWQARVRPRAVQVVFSVANILIATAACFFVYHAPVLLTLGMGSSARLVLAVSAFFVTNTVPIAAVIALTERKSLAGVWKECYAWSYPYYLVGAAIVGVITFADRLLNWEAWLLILPVVWAIYRSYHLAVGQLAAERKRAEEQSRHAEEVAVLHSSTSNALLSAMEANAKLDAVIQASPMAIFALDREGFIRASNSMAERMFGMARDESVQGRRFPLVRSRIDDVSEAFIRRTYTGEPSSGVELTQYRVDGTAFQGAVWTAPLRDRDGSVNGVLLTIADISRRKKLEEQLRMAQRMEAVGRLAGGVAHDFNNLLTIINGYSAMLQDSLKDRPHEAAQAHEILEAGERAASVVAKLLAFSRRQVVQPKALSINDLIRNIERMLLRLVGEQIELRLILSESAGWIVADASQIEAALMNLATNARDAMPVAGVFSIATEAVELASSDSNDPDALPPGSYVRIVVSDSGEGIDGETLQHIFEPFFTTKAVGKGTGLGLSSVYASTEQNGGRISVTSTVGRGTTFTIYLPRFDFSMPATSELGSSGRAERASNGTIILVEDEVSLRRMLRETLTRAGFRVWDAANGAEAIEFWSQAAGEVDLVVTDVVMPVMSGLTLGAELRRRKPHLPILFVSGHSEEVLSGQGMLEDSSALLLKPFLPAALVTKVREILQQVKAEAGGSPRRKGQAAAR